jgi:DNA-binding LacI/PurR family transcriptional regulator
MRSEDIAKLVGVSRSTVSRVINNYPDIPPSTREKVLKAITENNYVPNVPAQRLAGLKSRTLGIFLMDIYEEEKPHHLKTTDQTLLYNNSYFASFTNAFIDQANKADYYVLVSTVYNSEDFKKVQDAFYGQRIDAGVFIGEKESEYQYIYNSFPADSIFGIVDFTSNDIDKQKAILVGVNNYEGAFKAVEYLIGLGHRRIGIITGNIAKNSGKKRLEGYQNALNQYRLQQDPDLIAYGNYFEENGYQKMKQLLALSSSPTAVFCCNDIMAIGAYRAVSEARLRIPRDISIIGFDDIQISGFLSPPLTTVHLPLAEIAKNMANLLIQSIAAGKQEVICKLEDTTLIERASCRRIN